MGDDGQDPTSKVVLSEGSYVGQYNLLFGTPRKLSVKSLTHCNILSLNYKDFVEVLKQHPITEQEISELTISLYRVPMSRC